MQHNRGCILLSRSIFDSAIWRDNPHLLKLFIYLIGVARYKNDPKKYHGFEVNRGEVLTSLSRISEDNEYYDRTVKRWSRQKVSRMLDILEEQNYIKKLADTYGTHLTICNYDSYQDFSMYLADSDGTQVERKWNASGHNSKQDKQDKQEKQVNKKDIYIYASEISESLLKQFLQICKKKNKPLTERVWKTMVKEAGVAGLTQTEMIEKCIDKGWARFEADWLSDRGNGKKSEFSF